MELRKIRREGAAVSLQEPLESGSGQLTLADTLPDDTVMEDDCESRADAARLRRLVDTLPVRERAIMQQRYGLGGSVRLPSSRLPTSWASAAVMFPGWRNAPYSVDERLAPE